jgi:hypothetical protein
VKRSYIWQDAVYFQYIIKSYTRNNCFLGPCSGLVQEGLESPEIGCRLGYSAKTIRNTISKIDEKLGTRNRYEALELAIDMGLVGWRTGCEEI